MATSIKIYRDEPEDSLIPIRVSREGECVSIFFTSFKIGEIRNWRCTNCGKLLFQYEIEIGLVVDSSEIPKEKGSVNVRCPRCKLMFRIL